MKIIDFAVLMAILVSALFLAGCTGTAPAGPTATPTPQVIYVTVTATPTNTVSSSVISPAVARIAPAETAPAPAVATISSESDPILHRYMFTYPNSNGFMGNDQNLGREIKFFPGGTLYNTGGAVDYRVGYVTEISGNNIIFRIVSEGTGTWVPFGNNSYYIKILPAEQGGAQLIRHFILVPAHENPLYPGITDPEKLVGSDGTTFIRQKFD